MRVAIVHYHLRPGGVTRVIRTTAAALRARGVAVVVLADDVEGMGYGGLGDAAGLASRLRHAAANALGGPPDAWIIHNPTLGKNRDLPAAIERLARDGEAILLHIHDLAEDGRAANFANIPDLRRLHFTGPRVHHAFINGRDRRRFLAAGLPERRAHRLPNPVESSPETQPPPLPDPLVFFPVRGIRRKNLGEVCLWAALAPPDTGFAMSRAPENPVEIPTHDFWRMFAFSRRLPVRFDVVDRLPPAPGRSADFESWQAAASHWITTSVAEGFGQTAAEAAARGKPVIARQLECGFAPADDGGVYPRIEIIDLTADFADLDESQQAAWIDRILDAPEAAGAVRIGGEPAREWLRQRLESRDATPDPQLARHAPDAVAHRILTLLENLTRQPPGGLEFLPQQTLAKSYPPSCGLLAHARPPPRMAFPRAVIFDVYGTLLDAPPGGVRADPAADPAIKSFLEKHHLPVPASPTRALAELVRRDHAASAEAYPEIDLVVLWAELLGLPVNGGTALWVAEIEDLWHPARPMPGAHAMLRRLATAGIPCGLLTNAQSNVWRQLGGLAPVFASDLCVLSHQSLRAKPSPALFDEIAARLARRGIAPHDAWFVGNDPHNDIAPAAAAGFRTALYGPATASAELVLAHWDDFPPGHE